MKFWSRERILAVIGFIVAGVGVTGWQTVANNATNNPDSKQNQSYLKNDLWSFFRIFRYGLD